MRDPSGIKVAAEDGAVWTAAVTSFERTRRGAEPELTLSLMTDRARDRQLAMLRNLRDGLAALAALRWSEQ